MVDLTTLNQLSVVLKGKELLDAYCNATDTIISMEEIDKALGHTPVEKIVKPKRSKSGTKIQKDALAMLVKTVSKLRKVEPSATMRNSQVEEVLEDLQKFIKEKV